MIIRHMMCGATKLRRQRERATNVAFGVNAPNAYLTNDFT